MTYTLKHHYVDQDVHVFLSRSGHTAVVHWSESGTMAIRFPGRLDVAAVATYHVKVWVTGKPPPGDAPIGGGGHWDIQIHEVPLAVKIFTPDGKPFTSDNVTVADLYQFRDLRGTSQGSWTFRAEGQSPPIVVSEDPEDPTGTQVQGDTGRIAISVIETVASQSAPPLVADTLSGPGEGRYDFDLFRVGTFVATARHSLDDQPFQPHPALRLIDPDGALAATSSTGRLTHPITLETLDRSRDAAGRARRWSLQVLPQTGVLGGETDVRATVIGSTRINTSVLHDRIDALIGEHGSKIRIFGEMTDKEMLARLVILDPFSAETADMLGLLDSVIESVPQDPGADKTIKADVRYTLARKKRDLGEFHVSLDDMKITTIDIGIGASEQIQPAVPAFKAEVRVDGGATVDVGGFPLATIAIRDNRIRAEAGARLDPNGTVVPERWIEPDRIDIDLSWEAAVAAGVLDEGLLSLGASGVTEYLEGEYNDAIQNGFGAVVDSAMTRLPQILAAILGDDFTYQSLRVDGDDIVFDYIAPVEKEPKRTESYRGIIGRHATQVGIGAWIIQPPTLGDTWKADNLTQKIDHIVLVIMENRSFDHVLGYRAQLPGSADSDGLTSGLITFLQSRPFDDQHKYALRRLGSDQSRIKPNILGFKTKFPAPVGHSTDDVAEQLSETLAGPSGQTINSPRGFVTNFARRAATVPDQLDAMDVLGYYEAKDLPFYNFLADHYAHCERFFCSHPGPTLPNRMFSLSGDLQYDRTGEAVINNNNHDNFALSRAMTIVDLLTRKGIGWRVYESFPSVTMLRMFARYATDNTHIIDKKRLAQDAAAGNLPAVTIIDPAMHHSPETDDHSPFADMYRGQLFLKDIYDTLSSSPLWPRTLLIITYDEHGGFYDHVIPPMADVRERPLDNTAGGAADAPFTASTLTTNYGLRVPTFVVSPWVPAGIGPELVLDFCSILKTILARFCGQEKPFLSNRVDASLSLNAYLSEPQPRLDVPKSPDLPLLPDGGPADKPSINTNPISREQLRSGNVDYHDLSGMLARLLGRQAPALPFARRL